jgi:hypothetical protein
LNIGLLKFLCSEHHRTGQASALRFFAPEEHKNAVFLREMRGLPAWMLRGVLCN